MKSSRALLFLLPLLLWGCPARKVRVQGNTFVVGLESPPVTLDPRYAVDAYSSRILEMIAPGLTRVNRSGEVEPDLAEKIEVLSPTTVEILLKPGLSYDNGTPVSPEEVARFLKSFRDLPTPKAQGLQPITGIEATPRGVRLYLKEPFAPILVALNLPLVPVEELKQSRITEPKGAGPFRLVSFRSDEIVVKHRERDLFVRFRVFRDPTTLIYALERGDVDLAQNNVLAGELPRLKENPRLAVDEFPGWNVSYLGFRCDHPLLSLPEVRRALAMAIPREEIVTRILYGTATLTESLIPPQHWAYLPLDPIPYEPSRARALLTEALSRLTREGKIPAKLPPLVYKTSTQPERVKIAQVIASAMEKLGIPVEIQSLEFGTLLEHLGQGNFDLFSLTWVGISEPDILYYALHSRSIPPDGGNRGRCQDQELDQLLEEGRRHYDQGERKRVYGLAQRRVHELLPVFPLWIHKTIIVRARNLEGFVPLPSGNYLPLLSATRTSL